MPDDQGSKSPEPNEEEDDSLAFEEWPDEHLSDLGNARRMVRYFGEDLRYVAEWGWMCWDGTRWERDVTGAVMRYAEKTIDRMYEEAEELSRADRKIYRRHILRSESLGRMRAMVDKAASAASVMARPDQFDRDPWAFNCLSGTVDLRNGQLKEHRREDLISKLAPVAYDPAAECPRWEAFLEWCFAGDGELIGFFRRALGYTLTANTGEQVMFLLHGGGSNGKSTILSVIQTLLGDYGQIVPSETLLAKDRVNAGASPDVAGMAGSRFVYAVENEQEKKLAVALIKQLTGGDMIAARFLNRDYFRFKPVLKLWFAVNHKPVVKDTTDSIWRRVMLIPFEQKVSEEQKDTSLPEKLTQELPGIFQWALEGCLEWQDARLKPPQKVKAATAQYRMDMDIVQAFIDACCFVDPENPNLKVKASDLYTAYSKWATDNGERSLTSRQLYDNLREHGFECRTSTGNAVYCFGLGLLTDRESD